MAPSGILAAISKQSVSSQEGPSIWSDVNLKASVRTGLRGTMFDAIDPGSREVLNSQRSVRFTDATSSLGEAVPFCAGSALAAPCWGTGTAVPAGSVVTGSAKVAAGGGSSAGAIAGAMAAGAAALTAGIAGIAKTPGTLAERVPGGVGLARSPATAGCSVVARFRFLQGMENGIYRQEPPLGLSASG